ncbi:MAG: creatininase family protein [Pirellulaceae bacterium]|nr:creatininase family protein [Pirellulaceae bacterium]
MTKDSWRLAEMNYGFVKQAKFEVAVLPMGATEPHNLHLPYGTDCFEAQTIGDLACQQATREGASVVLLPTIPFGTETNLREFPLAINLNPSTLLLVIRDIVTSLVQSGIRKVVILNSHGGNDFKPVLRELYGQVDAHVFLYNWYQAIADRTREVLEHADDHAGEMETSFALAYFADFVAKNPDGTLAADDGAKRPTQFEAINQGWVSISRPWHLLTTNSGAGNPHAATAEKGKRLVQTAVERLASFLVELSGADAEDPQFPF